MSHLNFWPFNIAAKRREAEQAEKDRKAAHEQAYRALINKTRTVTTPTRATPKPPTPRSHVAPTHSTSATRRDDIADPLNLSSPLHPFNPLNPLSPVSVFNHTSHDEPTKSTCEPSYFSSSASYDSGSSSCDTGSSSSFD